MATQSNSTLSASLKSLEMGELVALYEACWKIEDIIGATANQPRCGAGVNSVMSGQFSRPSADLWNAVLAEIRSRKPTDDHDRSMQVEVLCRELIGDDRYGEALALIADAVRKRGKQAA